MRPELNRRFCGRCGEPCRGFEERAPEIDPPRRCADCAIERGLVKRIFLVPLTIVVFIPAAMVGCMVLIDVLQLIAAAVQFWTRPFPRAPYLDPGELGPLFKHAIFLLPLGAFAYGFWRLAAAEDERVREIRRRDLAPPRDAEEEADETLPASSSTDGRPGAVKRVPAIARIDRWMRPGVELPAPSREDHDAR